MFILFRRGFFFLSFCLTLQRRKKMIFLLAIFFLFFFQKKVKKEEKPWWYILLLLCLLLLWPRQRLVKHWSKKLKEIDQVNHFRKTNAISLFNWGVCRALPNFYYGTFLFKKVKTITFTLRGIDFLGPLLQNSDTYLFYFKNGSVKCAIQ